MHDTPVVLGDVIERNARYFPGKTAVIFEDRRVTFASFPPACAGSPMRWRRAACNARRGSPCWRRTAWNISKRSAPRNGQASSR